MFTGPHRQDDITTEAYEDELDMGRSGSYLNSSINSAWSEHSLDPEDIRVSFCYYFINQSGTLIYFSLLNTLPGLFST